MKNNKVRTYQIQSVDRALSLLEQYRGDVSELKLSELGRLLQINKNYVLRLLATLEAHSFVERNKDTGGYSLGPTPLKLGRSWLGNKQLIRNGRQSLEQVASACSETVYLAAFRDGRVTYVDRIESTLPVRAVSLEYPNLPLHCTAPGKIMLAHAEQRYGNHLITQEPLQKFTGMTIGDPNTLTAHLREIRIQGYAVDTDEFEVGLAGIAAPVFDCAARVVGVVGMVGPSFRLEEHKPAGGGYAQLIMNAAGNISRLMGFSESENLISLAKKESGGVVYLKTQTVWRSHASYADCRQLRRYA